MTDTSVRSLNDALLDALDDPLPGDAQPNLEITLHVGLYKGSPQLHIALRAGFGRLYVVRNMSAFLRALSSGERISFGKGFALEPDSMRFSRVDERILQLLMSIEAAQRALDPTLIAMMGGEGTSERRGSALLADAAGKAPGQMEKIRKFFMIPAPFAPRILRLLFARPFRLAARGQIARVECVTREPFPMRFDIKERADAILLSVYMSSDAAPLTEDCEFIYSAGRVHALDECRRSLIRAMLSGRPAAARTNISFPTDQAERFVAELLPQLEQAGETLIEPALAKKITRGSLTANVYLDREEVRVVARVAFRYADVTIDPFSPRTAGSGERALLMRDVSAERAVLEELSRAGFRVCAGSAYLQDSRQTLAFFLDGVQELMRRAQVYCSDRFQKMRPRRPSLSGRLTVQGGFLRFMMFEDDMPVEDALALLEALRDRRRYFRLKDGTFLDLEDLANWQRFAEGVADAASGGGARVAESGEIETGTYRAPEWLSLLEDGQPPIRQDASVRRVADAFSIEPISLPGTLNADLRAYQARGFAWLSALYLMNMGGVLADDMGLGKTVQMIAALCEAKEREGVHRSLVVAPTSLLYNWLAELNRFAPHLTVQIIDGSSAQRSRAWNILSDSNDTDVIVTSYPLLRRDIDYIEPLTYRMVILDEAQHIKNARSLASSLVKRLNAQARFALTGTPMENHPAELWSIFDFVLPGYLLTITQFLARHGAGQNAAALRRKIEPFLLRRLKKDVLPELPEKIEHTLWVDMPPEQKHVYAAAMQRARSKIERILSARGFISSRFEVLSLITELRQICCHPALRFEGYQGSSGKLDALIDLLPGALENGRRILLFSQFTRMLRLLQDRFVRQGVECLYLDGQTPTRERLQLTERFNVGEGQLFLISLKAGGSGLNLTGADMVVHYDPWWNPAAEDQATDRAHRIGQTRAVQVIRMITRGTIEEQVDLLRERKRALYDKLIPAEGQMPFSEDDVREMFLKEPLSVFGGKPEYQPE